MKSKTISNLPEIEILPDIEGTILELISKGTKITSHHFADRFSMTPYGLEKKLKKMEKNGLLKSSIQRVRRGENIKSMRVYERI